MKKQFYTKSNSVNARVIMRFIGLFIALGGFGLACYTFFPLVLYEIYVQPAFNNQTFASPIPQTNVITQGSLSSLIQNTATQLSHLGDSDDNSWLPPTTSNQYKEVAVTEQLSNYYLSIPSLGIENEYVSMLDNNVNLHLIQFPGTAVPPNVGNTAIYGHSTLPQWFNPHNPHAIFATALNTKIGDSVIITIGSKVYTYKVISMTIVPADDTSYLAQDTDGSYLSIITCTPPGTTWERLVIKSKLATT
jgi:sortase A